MAIPLTPNAKPTMILDQPADDLSQSRMEADLAKLPHALELSDVALAIFRAESILADVNEEKGTRQLA